MKARRQGLKFSVNLESDQFNAFSMLDCLILYLNLRSRLDDNISLGLKTLGLLASIELICSFFGFPLASSC